MCMEPESLVPITCSGARQVVLIGDHKQLQPVIQDHVAKTLGLSVSMFERYSNRAKMLELQYRMVSSVEHIIKCKNKHSVERGWTRNAILCPNSERYTNRATVYNLRSLLKNWHKNRKGPNKNAIFSNSELCVFFFS